MTDIEIRMWCIDRAQLAIGKPASGFDTALAAEIEAYVREGTLTERAKAAYESRNDRLAPSGLARAWHDAGIRM